MPRDIDQKKIEELLTRGVEHIYPTREFLASLLTSGKRLTVYTGYDPTAPTLHIGHGITLLKLRQFQELGHRIIMLIGDFTGMIGDPTDKLATRKQLTREEVLANCALYQSQAATLLSFSGKNKAELKFNSRWLGSMSFADILDLSSRVTVPRLLERDMFQERLKQGGTIHLHEFLYPLMQGYDSVAMDVDGEVGGNDQTFNMLIGRDLMKQLKEKEKFVVTMKLLADSTTGKKMSKSEGNMIAFSDTPEDMFGKVMRWDDTMIVNGFELCTRASREDIDDMKRRMASGENPRDFKLRLAYDITRTFLGEKAAEKGQTHFATVFQSHEKPIDIPEIKPTAYDILTVLMDAGFVKSRGDGRRDIEGGGVRVNDEKIFSLEILVKPGDIVQKGKRFFVKVR